MQTMAFIVGLFLLGYVAQRFIRDPAMTITWLNRYIIFIAMPSIILLKIPTLVFSPAMFIPAGFVWAWALIGSLMILGLSRALRFSRPLEGATLLLGILGNTAFFGFPMIQAFFNDEVLNYAVFYDQLGTFLVFSTVGLVILAVYSPNAKAGSGALNIADVARRIFSFPPFIALVIASTLPMDSLLSVAEPALILLAKPLMPLALFVIGLQFQPQLLPEHRLPLVTTITLKMVVAPLIAYSALFIANTPIAISQATVFEAAMPCMITPGILAIQAGLSPRFCATLLGYSTLFSFAWLPLLAYLIS